MATKITFFTHGITTDNERKIASGWNDCLLSTKGMSRTLELRGCLTDSYDIVYSSDLQRAVTTAELLFTGHPALFCDARLRECNYGSLNGSAAEQVEKLLPEKISEPFPGGESCLDVENRLAGFLTMIGEKWSNASLAIIGHKLTQLALEVLLNGKTWQRALEEDWRKTGKWQPGWIYWL